MAVSGLRTVFLALARSRRKPVLYPDAYLWLVFVSAMDIMLTWLILSLGGREVNPIANVVILHGGMFGAIVFKFSLIFLFIVVCEIVGMRRRRDGHLLARVGVAIGAVPIVYSMGLLVVSF